MCYKEYNEQCEPSVLQLGISALNLPSTIFSLRGRAQTAFMVYVEHFAVDLQRTHELQATVS